MKDNILWTLAARDLYYQVCSNHGPWVKTDPAPGVT